MEFGKPDAVLSLQAQDETAAAWLQLPSIKPFTAGAHVAQHLVEPYLAILSKPWIPCLADEGTCKCGNLFCPVCECHMNNIEPGDDGHTEGCEWARAAFVCGVA